MVVSGPDATVSSPNKVHAVRCKISAIWTEEESKIFFTQLLVHSFECGKEGAFGYLTNPDTTVRFVVSR